MPIYLAGVNEGDDRTYIGSMDKDVQFTLRNWYMDNWFGENKMMAAGYVSTLVVIFWIMAIVVGGVL